MSKTLTLSDSPVTSDTISGCLVVSYTVSGLSGTFTAEYAPGTTSTVIEADLQQRINAINARDYTDLASQVSSLNTALASGTYNPM